MYMQQISQATALPSKYIIINKTKWETQMIENALISWFIIAY